MKTHLNTLPALLLVGLAGGAWVSNRPAPAPVVAPLAADTYEVDGSHSFVTFRVGHLGIGTACGRFDKVAGTLQYDEANLAKSTLALEIDAASIDTNNEKRDAHLKGADFFSVKEYPRITFTSTKVGRGSEKGEFEVKGKLSLHGVEKEVTAQCKLIGSGKDPWGGTRVGFEAKFTVERMDFGIDYMPDGLGKQVEVFIAIEGVKKEG